jgi:uncharacterized protein YjbJ (UPF0337 family)
MDTDRISGSIKQAVGTVREMIGKLLGDRKTELEGTAQKVEGKTQNTIGGIKDTARDVMDRDVTHRDRR